MAVVSMKKQYAGHAKRVMMGCWSFLRQFMYTKFIIVVDDDVNVRDWKRSHLGGHHAHGPRTRHCFDGRHAHRLSDFASPVSGLGGKMVWTRPTSGRVKPTANGGRVIKKDPAVTAKIDEIWGEFRLIGCHFIGIYTQIVMENGLGQCLRG